MVVMRAVRPLVVQLLLVLVSVIPGVAAAQSTPASPLASGPPGGSPAPSNATVPCHGRVTTDVLPDWARAGFSDPNPSPIHAVGDSGEIVAILFGYPLTYPPWQDTNNKILWVARDITSATDLAISAQLMDGTVPIVGPVLRSVTGGPGPSIIDLPAAGCWRLTLSWGDQTDSVDLEYIAPAG
jgi:hypothetical protein